MPAQSGAQAGGGPNQMGAILGMLAQLLERIPGVVLAPAPVEPQEDAAMPEVVAEEVPVGVAEAEPVGPSYLRVMEHMQRLGTKFFSGGARPIESDGWRSQLERNFQSIRCHVEFRVDLAVHYLEGDAHDWWQGVVARRAGVVLSWDEFRREFDLKYFPQEVQDRLRGEFLYLTQGSRSVREYEAEFNWLKRFAGRGADTEHELICAFLRGMRLDLKNRCIVRKFESVSELVECAVQLEEGMRQEASLRAEVPEAPRRPQSQSVAQRKGGKSGQPHGQKRKFEDTSRSASSGPRCFRCGVQGHRIVDCPLEGYVCYFCKESLSQLRGSRHRLRSGLQWHRGFSP
ncbi:hypothetical protein V5N11_008452 [Cardamine amara subsp. amara]|uniref:CCHC-type domain-containing protein n=1 Tax=Cardamine amara subsp. amara TaxID=228776 RepID=A0ABD0ZW49_CARAN